MTQMPNSPSPAPSSPRLRVTGAVDVPCEFDREKLAAIDRIYQVPDLLQVGAKRPGQGVRLRGILNIVRPLTNAQWLGLHSSLDDFHASVPLAAVADRGILIYGREGGPLPADQGGPFRFYIPDHAACRVDEIDECANVKYVEHLEFTIDRGVDNRPQDQEEHAKIHAKPEA